MKQALGLVEIEGLSTAIAVADAMVKAANVSIMELENTRGLGYMTIKVTGDVGAVNAAVNVGCQVGIINGRLVSSKVIPRPSDYVEEFFVAPKPTGGKTKPEPKKEEPVKEEPVKEEPKKAEPKKEEPKIPQKKEKASAETAKPEKKDS